MPAMLIFLGVPRLQKWWFRGLKHHFTDRYVGTPDTCRHSIDCTNAWYMPPFNWLYESLIHAAIQLTVRTPDTFRHSIYCTNAWYMPPFNWLYERLIHAAIQLTVRTPDTCRHSVERMPSIIVIWISRPW
jgi:hypothetical protein